MKLAVLTGLLTGCGAGKLSNLLASQMLADTAKSQAQVTFNTPPPVSVPANYKFLFVVDESASNCYPTLPWNATSNGCPASAGGSDPTGSIRFGAINSFLSTLGSNSAVASAAYGLITFDGAADAIPSVFPAPPLSQYSNGLWGGGQFVTDPSTFSSIVSTAQADREDQGGIPLPTGHDLGTNYSLALAKAQSMIQNDIAACAALPGPAQLPQTYVIYLLSDGEPEEDGTPNDCDSVPISDLNSCLTSLGAPGGQIMNEAQLAVQAIVALAASSPQCASGVYLNTGYYASAQNPLPDPYADQDMGTLAQLGHGSEIAFADGSINLSQFKLPAIQVQIGVSDIYIHNMNTVWENGVLKSDSDEDGLSDDLEATLGSNANGADSDQNGVSDLVEYKLFGAPCSDAHCNSAYARDFSGACAAFLTSPPGQKPVTYMDSDGDGLNDCEELLIGTNSQRWDSNGNWIPDLLEYMAGMNPISGTDQSGLDPDNDGFTNLQEVHMGSPIYTNNSQILNYQPFNYQLTSQGVNADGSSTYQLAIDAIPIIGGANNVRIYVLMSSSGVKDYRYLRVAEKAVTQAGGTVFSDSDFVTPTVPRFECTSANPCQ